MKFLILCCFNEEQWTAIAPTKRDEIMHEYGTFMRELHEGGRLAASAKLQPSSTALTVRERSGKAVVTDGPFAESKEQLGGFHLIECRDRDEALSIAGRFPTLRYGGAVEVRPLAAESAA